MPESPPTDVEAPQWFRVLIVDDNRDAADSLAALARLWGHDTRVAYDGATALELARTFRPECLLLDIGMPGMDGYALAKKVREVPELRTAKLVALSAFSSSEHHRRVEEAGFDYSLLKPADPNGVQRLLTMIAQALKTMERTESLAQQTVKLAEETKELLSEVKEEIQEVKQEIQDVKQEIKETRESLEN